MDLPQLLQHNLHCFWKGNAFLNCIQLLGLSDTDTAESEGYLDLEFNSASELITNIPVVILKDQTMQADTDSDYHTKSLAYYKAKCVELSRQIRKLKSKKHENKVVFNRLVKYEMTRCQANQYIGKKRKFGRNYCVKDVVFAATLKSVSS